MASIRLILALTVANKRLSLRQFDVKTAFLYGDLPPEQRVYLQHVIYNLHRVSPYRLHIMFLLALIKSMYGLKHAPLQ